MFLNFVIFFNRLFLVFTVLFYLLWQFFGLNSKFFFSFWEPKCFIYSVAVTAKVTFNWQGFQQMDHGIARGCCVFIYCIICQSVLYVKLTLLCIVSYLALDSRDTNTKHLPTDCQYIIHCVDHISQLSLSNNVIPMDISNY